jgi:hypothetical protein
MAAPSAALATKANTGGKGGLFLQRKCACGGSAGFSGECEECGRKKLGMQAKLGIGASNDPLEQEADRVAEEIMSASAHPAVGSSPPRIQRCAEPPAGQTVAVPGSVDKVLSGTGSPLGPALRWEMERRFGHDFSRVRVHTRAAAQSSATDVQARAFTVGHDIVFARGQYAPGTPHGKRLLAHELTHVVQQEGHSGRGMLRRACSAGVARTPGCVPDAGITPPGTRFLFNVNCDDFAAGHPPFATEEARMDAFASSISPSATVTIVGMASGDGPADLNERLACSRAEKGRTVIRRSAPPGIAIASVQATVGGPGTAGDANMRAVGITVSTPTRPPAPETVRSTEVSAASFLSCAPCNPYTDDGTRGLSPPPTEPASGFRQKHSLVVAFTTADGIHVNPATVTTAKSDSIGITGYCGRTGRAHTVSTRGPFGTSTLPAGTHGEAVQVESELRTRLGATVPPTLPGSPCGFLGTASLVPAIGNRFRVRLFADGTVDSEFVAASSFPFHYLYEGGALKLFGGSPVSPTVDFGAWATSTGVPHRAALAGFKALREACCTGGTYFPCLSTCVGGFSAPIPSSTNLTSCAADATAKLFTPCPSSCAPAGSACATLSRPSNP